MFLNVPSKFLAIRPPARRRDRALGLSAPRGGAATAPSDSPGAVGSPRAGLGAARAADLRRRLLALSDHRREDQVRAAIVPEGSCGSAAVDKALLEARIARDGAEAALAAADAKVRLGVGLNPFSQMSLRATLRAHRAAAKTRRDAARSRAVDAAFDAAAFRASLADVDMTERRRTQNAASTRAKHPSGEPLVTAYNTCVVRAVRAIEREQAEEKRQRDMAAARRAETSV